MTASQQPKTSQQSAVLLAATEQPHVKHVLFHYPKALKPYRTSFNSWGASLFAVASGFPLDSVKTRLQTYKYNGNWHCIVDTYKNEGVLGFYRGLTAPLISSSLMRSWALSIFTYSKPISNQFWSGFYDTTTCLPSSSVNTMDYVLRGFPVSFLSGSLAGISTSIASCPFELTKLGSQIELVMKRRDLELKRILAASQSHASLPAPPIEVQPLGTFQIAKRLVAHSGPLALYSGYRYQLARDIVGTGIYFGVYDSIKSGVGLHFFGTADSHPVSVAIAGGLSGAFGWIFIYPLDTIKSRYQRDVMARVLAESNSSSTTVNTSSSSSSSQQQQLKPPPNPQPKPKIKLRELFQAKMYRGLAISLLRTSILGTTMFSVYEVLMRNTD